MVSHAKTVARMSPDPTAARTPATSGTLRPKAVYVSAVPITVIISLVPISINGVGVRETGYVFLLAKIGHSNSEAVSLSLLIYGLSLLASLAGGMLYIIRGKPGSIGGGQSEAKAAD